ncbi:hypothetical protein [Gluconobacter kanchanaburiensis]|uniref:Uncharacterized protein n=1 Tax=Gluconobacter kanchanaburiensis NBRC 103587 TaxID=1307948 RepID=A0A511B5P1_9PROT|nr:hypothetical protein [Gluconobacter kanchanaburiensis]GBR69803.1 hypothetical protein AA103587_1527 [Gluconobacter kanchanaburiensis NBRC 103587]GEK95032.1 hypothetical protein GKA01_02290 [Gluconobacter kanchanaburiensis NBRC 103587]
MTESSKSVSSDISTPQTEDIATFRHDLRNALAPALLCADILKSHSDPAVKENAATIVTALEKALKLLKKASSSQ